MVFVSPSVWQYWWDISASCSSGSASVTHPGQEDVLDKPHEEHAAVDPNLVYIPPVVQVLALARGLGIETTAEGVETPEQAECMRRLGVGQLQGFLFGRPALALAAPVATSDDDGERRRA